MSLLYGTGIRVASIHFDLGRELVKFADDKEIAYNLYGRLYATPGGWIMLSVPNSLVRGIFSAMHEPGAELPPSGEDGQLNAHISVMRPEEVEIAGGVDAVTERGKQFAYTIGRLYSVEPDGWSKMERVWFLGVHSPALQELRRSYGLSSLPNDGKFAFHVTCAAKRRGITGRNVKSKSNPDPRAAGGLAR